MLLDANKTRTKNIKEDAQVNRMSTADVDNITNSRRGEVKNENNSVK